jgi:hypothetical protein
LADYRSAIPIVAFGRRIERVYAEIVEGQSELLHRHAPQLRDAATP